MHLSTSLELTTHPQDEWTSRPRGLPAAVLGPHDVVAGHPLRTSFPAFTDEQAVVGHAQVDALGACGLVGTGILRATLLRTVDPGNHRRADEPIDTPVATVVTRLAEFLVARDTAGGGVTGGWATTTPRSSAPAALISGVVTLGIGIWVTRFEANRAAALFDTDLVLCTHFWVDRAIDLAPPAVETGGVAHQPVFALDLLAVTSFGLFCELGLVAESIGTTVKGFLAEVSHSLVALFTFVGNDAANTWLAEAARLGTLLSLGAIGIIGITGEVAYAVDALVGLLTGRPTKTALFVAPGEVGVRQVPRGPRPIRSRFLDGRVRAGPAIFDDRIEGCITPRWTEESIGRDVSIGSIRVRPGGGSSHRVIGTRQDENG